MNGPPVGEGGEAAAGSPSPGSAPTWRVRHAVLAFAAGIGASLVAALVVAPEGITSFEAFAVVAPAQAVAVIGVATLLRRFPRPGRESLGLRFAPADGWGLLLGAGLELALSLVLSLFVVVFLNGEAPVQEAVRVADEAVGVGTRVAVVVTAVVVAPLAEELVFRGILLRALTLRFPRRMAALGSAAAFALAHLLDPNAALAVPALFVMGLVLARQVLGSGRLGGAVLAHAGFNLVSVLLLFFA